MSAQAIPGKVTARGAQASENGGVLLKLILFSVALGVVPLGSYFASEKYVFNGNSTYAAVVAIVAANGVLVAYILASILEDNREKEEKEAAAKPGVPVESRKER